MTPEQRRRAGRAVDARIAEMHATKSAVARAAEIDATTIRAVIAGRHWPTDAVQSRLEKVLRWRPGEFHARSCLGDDRMDTFSDLQLAIELATRIRHREERDSRLRNGDRRRKRFPASGNLAPETSAG